MYNGCMKRQSVAKARARSSDPFEAAEKSLLEVIERRTTRRKMIDDVDPHVAEGQWTWESDGPGLEFREQRRRR
jgi:hypothetical protein